MSNDIQFPSKLSADNTEPDPVLTAAIFRDIKRHFDKGESKLAVMNALCGAVALFAESAVPPERRWHALALMQMKIGQNLEDLEEPA